MTPLNPVLKEVLRGETQSSYPWMYHDEATAGLVSRRAIGLLIQSTFKMRGCSGWPGLSCNDSALTPCGTTTLSRAAPTVEGRPYRGRLDDDAAVTVLRHAKNRTRAMTVAPRVGLVGLLGQGNLGNDGSLEAVLAYLDAGHPDAILDFLCTGTDQMMARYGVPETRLRWYNTQTQRAPGVTALAAKSLMVPLGMIVDAFRMGTWVRRHDVVMVPGMGVLETSLPLRSWHTPHSMFLVSAFGRLFGTKVALVSVGANDIRQPLARRLVIAAARLAYYRSFRDSFPRDAMRRMGLNTSGDAVYPDLAFALPAPRDVPVVAGMVGVGVMDYHGSNDDRRQADQLHASYAEKMKSFVLWLVDNGRSVRLFTTDKIGGELRRGIEKVVAKAGLSSYFQVRGRDCNLTYLARDQAGQPSQAFRTLVLQELIDRGILAPSFVVCAAHEPADIRQTVDAVAELMPVYQRALESGIDQVLRGRPVRPALRARG